MRLPCIAKIDLRVALAVLALALASCQGGLDSGMGGMGGGMGGDMGPPVQNPGQIGGGMESPGMPGGGTEPGEMNGPAIGLNGEPTLTRPGATLAPNEAQYPVGQGPNGLPCPRMQGQLSAFTCTISFNVPAASPSPSPSASASAKPASGPSPKPTGSADAAATPSPTPTPPGTITMLAEPLPKDLPPMTNPDPRALHEIPLVAIRLQSDTNFALHDDAVVAYTLARTAFGDGSFALQLFNETSLRGKRVDQFIAGYSEATTTDDTGVRFAFTLPKVVVKQGQVWLLALYGLQYPPGTTPSPSPSPGASASPADASAAPSPTPSPKPT